MGLFKRIKNNDKPLIHQILDLIHDHLVRGGIQKYQTDKYCHKYKTRDQLVALLFGQLCRCSTLEDISVGIGVCETFIKDLGLLQSPAKSTMSDGNRKRDWRVFEYIFTGLLDYYRKTLHSRAPTNVIDQVDDKTVLIRDSSTIGLCLSLFDWAKFRTAKGGLKIHTQWDEAIMLPELVNITPAKVHDSKGFEQSVFAKDTIIIEDKGYWDFDVIKARQIAGNTFVTRIKDNIVYQVAAENDLPEDDDHHILVDEMVYLTETKAIEAGVHTEMLRRVVVYDANEDTTLEILTNNLYWQVATVTELYRRRWNIETFSKLLKQNLNVKTFVGTSENAVKAQMVEAFPLCALMATIKLLLNSTVCVLTKTLHSN